MKTMLVILTTTLIISPGQRNLNPQTEETSQTHFKNQKKQNTTKSYRVITILSILKKAKDQMFVKISHKRGTARQKDQQDICSTHKSKEKSESKSLRKNSANTTILSARSTINKLNELLLSLALEYFQSL